MLAAGSSRSRTLSFLFRCPAVDLISSLLSQCPLSRQYRLLSILWLTALLFIWLHTSHALPRKCGKVCEENAISVHGMGVQEKSLYVPFLFLVIGNRGPVVMGFLVSLTLCCDASNRSQNKHEQSISPGSFFSGWQWSFSADANSQACFIALLPFYSFRGWEAVRTQTASESVTRPWGAEAV